MKKKLIDILIFIFFAIALFSGVMFIITFPAFAKDEIFIRKVIEVIDGDTVKINVDEESDLIQKLGYSIRIYGIDAPEIHTKSKCEKLLGLQAKKFLHNIILTDRPIKIINPSWDAYGGRILADLEVDGKLISEAMLKSGHAARYTGGKKEIIWCKD